MLLSKFHEQTNIYGNVSRFLKKGYFFFSLHRFVTCSLFVLLWRCDFCRCCDALILFHIKMPWTLKSPTLPFWEKVSQQLQQICTVDWRYYIISIISYIVIIGIFNSHLARQKAYYCYRHFKRIFISAPWHFGVHPLLESF